jgi:hypothetical protein
VSAPLYSVTRAERAAEAVRLRAEGLSARQIAEALGVSRSYASLLYTDPDGTREAKRRERYGRECEDCGTRTFGGNGAAKAPKLCVACTNKPGAGARDAEPIRKGLRLRSLSRG